MEAKRSSRQTAEGMAVAIRKDPGGDERRGRGKELVRFIGSIWRGAFSSNVHLQRAARSLDRPHT